MMTPTDRPFQSSADDCWHESLVADEQKEWQVNFHGLEQWICELLIKNQQLRMALMEMKAGQRGDAAGDGA